MAGSDKVGGMGGEATKRRPHFNNLTGRSNFCMSLGQYVFDHTTMHIGQAALDAVVIEA